MTGSRLGTGSRLSQPSQIRTVAQQPHGEAGVASGLVLKQEVQQAVPAGHLGGKQQVALRVTVVGVHDGSRFKAKLVQGDLLREAGREFPLQKRSRIRGIGEAGFDQLVMRLVDRFLGHGRTVGGADWRLETGGGNARNALEYARPSAVFGAGQSTTGKLRVKRRAGKAGGSARTAASGVIGWKYAVVAVARCSKTVEGRRRRGSRRRHDARQKTRTLVHSRILGCNRLGLKLRTCRSRSPPFPPSPASGLQALQPHPPHPLTIARNRSRLRGRRGRGRSPSRPAARADGRCQGHADA